MAIEQEHDAISGIVGNLVRAKNSWNVGKTGERKRFDQQVDEIAERAWILKGLEYGLRRNWYPITVISSTVLLTAILRLESGG